MTGYSLKLNKSHKWHLMATDGTEEWLKGLASIMRLKESAEGRGQRLIFFRKGRIGKEYRRPPDGWGIKDFKSMRFWQHKEAPYILCEIDEKDGYELDIIRMFYALHPVYDTIKESGGMPLHAALVRYKEAGILLAGAGGTGKSTSCQRLPRGWQVLCDDEVLVVRDGRDRYFAHPFPTWSDYLWRRAENRWDVQRATPLKALFFLEQAKKDEVKPLTKNEAVSFITESTMEVSRRDLRYLSGEEQRISKARLFHNACGLAGSMPSFILQTTISGKFWVLLEEVLSKDV